MARKGENIYKRKDGRWEGRYVIGRKPNGQARYASIYGKTYRDVKDALERKKGEQYRTKPNCGMTVKSLMAMWLSLRSTEIKASSYQRYQTLIEGQIIPRLGQIRVSNLTAEIISSFLKELMEHGRLDGTGGLSASTVSGIMGVLRSALRLASKQYAVRDIAVFDVKGPAVRQPPAKTLNSGECESLVRCVMAEPDLSGAAYLLALNCGLRLGEICGLMWSDISFTEGTLTVNRTALRIREEGKTILVVQPPKTENANRSIPLTFSMLRLLAQLRNNAKDSTFVFTGTKKPLEPRTLEKRFLRFLKEHGLRCINLHGLRHTFATRCIEEAIDAKTVSELLGHSHVKMTLQRYVHPSMETKRKAVEAASAILPVTA